MLYFSRGSLRGTLRRGDSVCPETLGSESIQVKPRSRLAIEAVENLIALLKGWSLKNWERSTVNEFHNPEIAARRPVIQNGQVVELYSVCV